MNTKVETSSAPPESLWHLAMKRLFADRVAMASFAVVALFIVMLFLSLVGLIASDWEKEVGVNYAPPHFVGVQQPGSHVSGRQAKNVPENPRDPLREVIRELRTDIQANRPSKVAVPDYGIKDPLQADLDAIRGQLQPKTGEGAVVREQTLLFGADKWGHDVLKKVIKGSETSIVVGLVAALVATVIGTVLGALSGYFEGWLDDCLNWFYSVFTSIPYLLLILAVAAVLQSKGIMTIILILGLTGWTGVFRLVRAEYMKHRDREYVMAAGAIGASHWRRIFVHIFPNISHIPLVQFSLMAVGFIKSEVILSFLGFGVPVGEVSWGSMLNEAQNELILGKWWQLAAVTVVMAVLITALSLFTDGLRDALDPKLKQGQ